MSEHDTFGVSGGTGGVVDDGDVFGAGGVVGHGVLGAVVFEVGEVIEGEFLYKIVILMNFSYRQKT